MSPRPCDFCNGRAEYRYAARPTVTRATVTRPNGAKVSMRLAFPDADWLACEPCRVLIASGRRDELAGRTEAAWRALVPRSGTGLDHGQRQRAVREQRALARALHDDFWAARHSATPQRAGGRP